MGARTVTEGRPVLTDVIPESGFDKSELLRLAASAERGSEHPLGEAIVQAATQQGLSLTQGTGFRAIPGHGIEVTVEGRPVLLGNAKLMRDRRISLGAEVDQRWSDLAADGKTFVQPRGSVRVKNGLVHIQVRVPGAERLIRDTIVISSKMLKEEQTLELVFEEAPPRDE